jgi:hydrogenase nickel incorporation protein HypB
VDFDVERCAANARLVKPQLQVFPVSATKGDGLDAWYEWLMTAPAGVARTESGY